MFLNQLSECNKVLFVKLAFNVAMADNVLVAQEKSLIAAYCREMGLPESAAIESCSIDELINEINKNATQKEKNIILLEIIGLVYVDGVVDTTEQEIIEKLIVAFEFDKAKLQNIMYLVEDYLVIYNRAKSIIEE